MNLKIVALAGGVGGAKLAHGLAKILSPENLTIIVNTGDDFEHHGLYISPDLDTVCYTLAGLANPVTGWGRVNESWNATENIAKLGGQTWFQLGDRDLATHLMRTSRLKKGDSLSAITHDFCHAWGIEHRIIPMTDDYMPTIVDTVEMGELPFQEYFVHQRCKPTVKGFRFEGVESVRPAEGVEKAINDADAVVICPSNPWVSIAPILAATKLNSTREAGFTSKKNPIVALSPIIGGEAVKGPAAKMYRELGIEPSALAVAKGYEGFVDGFIFDKVDAVLEPEIQNLGMKTMIIDSYMKDINGRERVAKDVLKFIHTLL
ncbi:MAG: 2-phospho-L-lactate transferase [Anaerolineae bacterium]|jgi:LPPG:FO 2-phospho-L-lactate transferase|nr:2-phospho-L-lactate transferase [Anaerolineae bacterium]MBT7074233.1 2-phospho-L-lactate transferase [Anaerolineae bacterium]MBT7783566.1 2-phospho-L-lactate transferase [Anaerolineae bacterium]